MATMPEHSKYADKYQQHRKIFYLCVCVLTVILSIVGICMHTNLQVSQDIYIAILVFSLICLIIELTFRLLRNSGAQSKYEVNENKKDDASEKKVEKKESSVVAANGVENKAFDAEKGDGNKEEKWVKNYVPFEDYPDGGKAADTVTVESDTTEQKRREEEKGEKENKDEAKPKEGDEKWKDNYVAYEEEAENNKE